MKDKRIVWLLVAAGVAVVAYVAYRWYQANASSNSPTGSLGTNLNSVAPELVGGSAGPSVGPAFNMPVNVTYTQSSSKSAEMPDTSMLGVNAATGNNLTDTSADQPGSMDTGMDDETAADNSSTYSGGDTSGGGTTDISVPASDVTVNTGKVVGRTPVKHHDRDRDKRRK